MRQQDLLISESRLARESDRNAEWAVILTDMLVLFAPAKEAD